MTVRAAGSLRRRRPNLIYDCDAARPEACDAEKLGGDIARQSDWLWPRHKINGVAGLAGS